MTPCVKYQLTPNRTVNDRFGDIAKSFEVSSSFCRVLTICGQKPAISEQKEHD